MNCAVLYLTDTYNCLIMSSTTVFNFAFSVLNGRISRELGFEKTFVPPGPGDEGVAVGCALYGLQVEYLCCSLCIELP